MTIGSFVAQDFPSLTDYGTVYTADFDGDGDRDLVTAGDGGEISWQESVPGDGVASQPALAIVEPQLLGSSLGLEAADFDGDGDIDLATVQQNGKDSELGWLENRGDEYHYSRLSTGSDPVFQNLTKLAVVDVNRDGPLDIVTNIFRWPNVDGLTVFSAAGEGGLTLAWKLDDFGRNLVTADIDLDGDMDLLVENWEDSSFQWIDALGGEVVSTFDSFASVYARCIVVADLDVDGDLDLVSLEDVEGTRNSLQWYENTNGRGEYAGRSFEIEAGEEIHAVLVRDLDGDGDPDIVTSHGYESSGYFLQVHDNIGELRFQSSEIPVSDYFGQIEALDIDGDGDLDLVDRYVRDGKLVWYEQKSTVLPGDADRSGTVDFSDFLIVSHNFGRDMEAAFADGDFNADQRVDFADFLILSQNFGARLPAVGQLAEGT